MLCQFCLPQGYLRFMQIEAGIGESQVRFAVARFSLEGRFEVRRGRLRLVKIVQHVAAVHICRNHLGIPIQRLSKVLPRLIKESSMLMHITLQQRNVGLFWKNVDILCRQSQELIVLPKMEQIVTEIDNDVPVSW